jgi:dimethylargininase
MEYITQNVRRARKYRMSRITRAIVRTPAATLSDGLRMTDQGTPDYERAVVQHEAYCAALEVCGVELTRLPSIRDYPDSTFVEDTAILTNECAILTRPGAPTRVGEVGLIAPGLKTWFSTVESIEEPGTVDGGDICEAGNHFFIGISERTNEAGAQQLSRVLGKLGHGSTFIDIRGISGLLHLKSGLAYLGDKRLVVTNFLANLEEFAGYELVQVVEGEEYAANCVCINDEVLIARGFPVFAATLASLEYKTTALDMSEFQKLDGGLSCLSLRF